MVQRCLNCGVVLFKLDEVAKLGAATFGSDVFAPLEEEDGVEFFRCPSCKAKNVAEITKNEQGVTLVRIVKVKD